MKKKILLIILLLSATLIALLTTVIVARSKSPYEFSLLENDTYKLVYADTSLFKKQINIPKRYKGKPVTVIGKGSFYFISKKYAVKISIPDSVVSIENSAFDDIHQIKRIKIGASVETIEEGAFRWCHIEEICLDKNNSSFEIKNGCLCKGNQLVIGVDCSAVPDGITRICSHAFSSQIIQSIEIPDSCIEIGDCSFASCERLEIIDLPDHLNKIGSYAFSYCSKLEQIELPQRLQSVGEAFMYKSAIREIIIPGEIKIIPSNAFMLCMNLEKVTIMRGVEEIQDQAFLCCFRMKTIEIPDSVTLVGTQSFSATVNLTIKIERSSIPKGWSAYWLDYCPYWLDDPEEVFEPEIIVPQFCS